MKIEKMQVFKAGTTLLLTGTLVLSMAGCAKQSQSAEVSSSSITTEQIKDAYTEKGSSSSAAELSSASSTSPGIEVINNNLENADSAVEAAIGIMLESAEQLSLASDQAKETEAYQKAKEETKQNFDDLFRFLLGEKEIAGYTIDDVKDSTKETVLNALFTLDNYIEEYIPDYKNKAKEKLNSIKEWLTSDETVEKIAEYYNKFRDYKDRIIDTADKQRQR